MTSKMTSILLLLIITARRRWVAAATGQCLSLEISGCESSHLGKYMNGVYTPFTGDCNHKGANNSVSTIDTTNNAAYYSEDLNNYLYLLNETSSLWVARGGTGQEWGGGSTWGTGHAGEFPYEDTADTWLCDPTMWSGGDEMPMSIECTEFEGEEVRGRRGESGARRVQEASTGRCYTPFDRALFCVALSNNHTHATGCGC